MAKKQKESNVSDAIRLELAKRGCRIFRSQVGLFYTQYRRNDTCWDKRGIGFTWS